MSVNSEMTAIADLIRGLRGVSGKMGLDAMKGHLQDEQDGLDSALTALSEKGVTVPDGTKVDGLAALIAAIEAGGGSGGVNIATGTITFAENQKSYLGFANLDFTPVLCALSRIDLPTTTRHAVSIIVSNVDGASFSEVSAWLQTSPSLRYYGYRNDGAALRYNDNEPVNGCNTYLYLNSTIFCSGTYQWVAIG